MSDRSNEQIGAIAARVFTPNYRPAPIVLDRGEGVRVFDVEGNEFLDMVSGIAVSALGHNHAALVAAITEQAGKILHTSNLYLNEPSVRLAELMTQSGWGDRVYFCNSGAEANESSIKLARKFAFDAGEIDRVDIVSFDGSFHGRTFGALTATAQPKYHKGFEPLPAGFRYLPFGDLDALETGIGSTTAAVIVEPIQGEGGVRVPEPGFLAAIRARCDSVGALLIFDEVQVGVGRTGRLYGHEHEGVTPDIMSLAKGIGGGLPLGALVTTARVADSLSYGSHATTYGGNPVACAAGRVVLETILADGFLPRVERIGAKLADGLRAISARTGVFSDVRGRGLLLGAELGTDVAFDARALVEACRALGILVHLAGPRVLRLAPPLIIDADDAQIALDGIGAAVDALLAE